MIQHDGTLDSLKILPISRHNGSTSGTNMTSADNFFFHQLSLFDAPDSDICAMITGRLYIDDHSFTTDQFKNSVLYLTKWVSRVGQNASRYMVTPFQLQIWTRDPCPKGNKKRNIQTKNAISSCRSRLPIRPYKTPPWPVSRASPTTKRQNHRWDKLNDSWSLICVSRTKWKSFPIKHSCAMFKSWVRKKPIIPYNS